MEVYFKEKLENKEIKISIFGLGYVGLPLFVNLMKIKKDTIGFDIDDTKLTKLKNKLSYIDDVENSEIEELILKKENLSDDYEFTIFNSDISFIALPTPVNLHGVPDLDAIYEVIRNIGIMIKRKKSPHIIVLESTTYPSTTDVDLNDILKSMDLMEDSDYALVYSPERIDPGNKNFNVTNIPKLVGTSNDNAFAVTQKIYNEYLGINIFRASSARVAEFTKLFENIFRQVNIALVNELSLLAEKLQIDMFEVVNLASTKPFGFLPHYPGPGLGGHCIPVDPYYMSHIAKKYYFNTKFINLSSEVNDSMRDHTVNLIKLGLSRVNKSINGANIGILGYSYKPNISDSRNSPAKIICEKINNLGGEVLIHDEYIEKNINLNFKSLEEIEKFSDIIVIITPHSNIDYEKLIRRLDIKIPLIDTRGTIPFEMYRKFDIGLGRPIDEFKLSSS